MVGRAAAVALDHLGQFAAILVGNVADDHGCFGACEQPRYGGSLTPGLPLVINVILPASFFSTAGPLRIVWIAMRASPVSACVARGVGPCIE